MRVNAKALMRVGEIRCHHQDPSGHRRPARACLITEETVRQAREMGEADPSLRSRETSPDVRYGGVLAYISDAAGAARCVFLPPGQDGGLTLTDGTRFLGPDMFSAEAALAATPGPDPDRVRALLGIRSVFRMVAAAPDEERFPVGLIAQAYRSALRSAFGPALLPVGEEGLVRKCQADLVRARIAELDPSSPDAIGQCEPFLRVLDRAGADARAEAVRLPGLERITREEARLLLNRAPFRDRLFGALALTPTERIEAAVLPIPEVEEIERSLAGSRLGGLWADRINRIASELTGSGAGSGWYRIELTLFVSGGRDLMILSDSVGREAGIALAYSWPSAERRPVLQAPSGPVYAISPQEVPDEEELIRLRRVLSELEQARTAKPSLREALDA